VSADQFERRKQLTFAQAEGVAPLPRQLAMKEVSPELRSRLWLLIHSELKEHYDYRSQAFIPPWEAILLAKHVSYDHGMIDEFERGLTHHQTALKQIFLAGDYVAIFDFLQWLLRLRQRSVTGAKLNAILEDCRSPYRVFDGDTIAPIASEDEAQTLERAFADLASSEFSGAREHLRKAAEQLTAGRSADSIRESIQSVESVARSIAGESSLSAALKEIEKSHRLHGALKTGFSNLYGFTSDEQGIRHPLLDQDAAAVDETDAIFMIGACAAFVSYLIARTIG
jgi:hypothetical protein